MSTLIKRPNLLSRFFDDDSLGFPDGWFDERMPRAFKRLEMPAVNIKENANDFELEFALPGFKKEDLKVNVENGVLTVSSEKRDEKSEEKKGWTRKEFNYAAFNRSFQLPENTDADGIQAAFADGVLRLKVTKTKPLPERKGREVRIG